MVNRVEHLKRARSIKHEKMKARKLEELAKLTEDDDDQEFRNELLKKAKESFKKTGKIIKEEPKPEETKTNDKVILDLQEELKQIREELKTITSNDKNEEDNKLEDIDEDNDEDNDEEVDIDEDIDDLQEDLVEELEETLDEDEQNIFDLLNKLNELEIRKVRQEYEKTIEDLKEEQRRKSQVMEAIRNRLKSNFEKEVKEDILNNDEELLRYINTNVQAYIDFNPLATKKGIECFKEKCIQQFLDKKAKVNN